MEQSLDTTNLLLGIMAAVSVLQALVLIGAGIAAFMIYRRVLTMIQDVERRQVAPAMTRVHAILDDVQAVTATVRSETHRVDHAIHNTMHRVDDTVDRVRDTVRSRTDRLIGIVRGARVALETILTTTRAA